MSGELLPEGVDACLKLVCCVLQGKSGRGGNEGVGREECGWG